MDLIEGLNFDSCFSRIEIVQARHSGPTELAVVTWSPSVRIIRESIYR